MVPLGRRNKALSQHGSEKNRHIKAFMMEFSIRHQKTRIGRYAFFDFLNAWIYKGVFNRNPYLLDCWRLKARKAAPRSREDAMSASIRLNWVSPVAGACLTLVKAMLPAKGTPSRWTSIL